MDYAVCDVVAFFLLLNHVAINTEFTKIATQTLKNKQNKTLQADAFNLLFSRFVVLAFAPNTWFSLFRLMKIEKSGSNYPPAEAEAAQTKKNNVEIQKGEKNQNKTNG